MMSISSKRWLVGLLCGCAVSCGLWIGYMAWSASSPNSAEGAFYAMSYLALLLGLPLSAGVAAASYSLESVGVVLPGTSLQQVLVSIPFSWMMIGAVVDRLRLHRRSAVVE